MKKILSLILLSLLVYSFNSCGSRRTTVIVVQPKQIYSIVIEEISGVNPVGELHVIASNKYSSDSTEVSGKNLELYDLNDNYPITFKIVDSISTIYEKTITLTDFLDADELILVDPIDGDNFIKLTFGIVIEN